MKWEVAATFDTVASAESAVKALESHGVTAMVASGPSDLQLLVAASDLETATALLDPSRQLPPTDEEIAAAIAAEPDLAVRLADPSKPEPFVDNPTDRQIKRLLIVSVFGLLCLSADAFVDLGQIVAFNMPLVRLLAFPLHLYALYLAWTLRRARPPVTRANAWKIWLSLGLNVFVWIAVIVPIAFMVNLVHDSDQTAWRNERFGGLGDVALTIDFPAPYAVDLGEEATIYGRAKARAFGTIARGEHFQVTILSLEKNALPADGKHAARVFAENQFLKPGIKLESLTPIEVDGFPGVEVIAQTGNVVVREKAIVIGDHIVELRTRAAARESDAVARFFGSAKIQ